MATKKPKSKSVAAPSNRELSGLRRSDVLPGQTAQYAPAKSTWRDAAIRATRSSNRTSEPHVTDTDLSLVTRRLIL
jgi:hypothetical protein